MIGGWGFEDLGIWVCWLKRERSWVRRLIDNDEEEREGVSDYVGLHQWVFEFNGLGLGQKEFFYILFKVFSLGVL